MTEPASPPATRIILVRHGESVANAGGRTADHTTNPLTELGQLQAKDFAGHLTGHLDCRPTLFVVSPFLRAQQTFEPVRQRFPDVPVEEWPVHEFDFLNPAVHNGTSDDERQPHAHIYWQREDPAYIDGPGAESFSLFLDRAREAIDRLVGRNPGGCVVIFSHGYFMQAFRLVLLFPDASDRELMRNFRRFHLANLIQNTDAFEFEVGGGKIQLVRPLPQAGFTLQGENSHA